MPVTTVCHTALASAGVVSVTFSVLNAAFARQGRELEVTSAPAARAASPGASRIASLPAMGRSSEFFVLGSARRRGTAGCLGACVLGLAGQEPECCVRLPPTTITAALCRG